MKVFCSMLACVVLTAGLLGVTRAQNEQSSNTIVSSTLFDDVRQKLKDEPKIAPVELAKFANDLLATKGIDFQFDLCEFVEQHNPPRPASSKRILIGSSMPQPDKPHYRLPMKQTNGRQITFETSRSEEQMEGLCGECFFGIPATRVTTRQIELIAGGRKYRLTRPRLFGLDEMSLVDESMRRVLRTWQVPDQGEPLGVSSDGTKLYLATAIDALILEISETSALRILAREQIKLPKGEIVQKHPTDPKNAYLSFMRFRFGRRRFVIRYSNPCT